MIGPDYRYLVKTASRPNDRAAKREEVTAMEALAGTNWQQYPAAAVILLGLAVVWRGLLGWPYGGEGLLRRNVNVFDRLQGWRLFLLGLTIIGLGAAWYWDARWLLFLSLGIGFVELQEATRVINAWRWRGTGASTRTQKQGQTST
jgi:hypothetical protein